MVEIFKPDGPRMAHGAESGTVLQIGNDIRVPGVSPVPSRVVDGNKALKLACIPGVEPAYIREGGRQAGSVVF